MLLSEIKCEAGFRRNRATMYCDDIDECLVSFTAATKKFNKIFQHKKSLFATHRPWVLDNLDLENPTRHFFVTSRTLISTTFSRRKYTN